MLKNRSICMVAPIFFEAGNRSLSRRVRRR
jgi:hypothetical protein